MRQHQRRSLGIPTRLRFASTIRHTTRSNQRVKYRRRTQIRGVFDAQRHIAQSVNDKLHGFLLFTFVSWQWFIHGCSDNNNT